MKKTTDTGFRFGEFNIPDTPEDMAEISKSVKKVLNSSENLKKNKTTHSISKLSQVLIKDFAEECKVTQGSIVEIAPLLFRMLTIRSMEKRKKSLDTLLLLKNQISSSLESIAQLSPHLKCYVDFIDQALSEMFKAEISAVNTKNYKGVDRDGFKILSEVPDSKENVPYYKEVRESLNDSEVLLKLFETLI